MDSLDKRDRLLEAMNNDENAAGTSSEAIELPFTRHDWKRLRETWSAIKSSQALLQRSQTELEKLVQEDQTFRDNASHIQNKRIAMRMLEERIKSARRGIQMAYVNQGIAREEDSRLEKEDELLQRSVIDTGDEGVRMAEQSDELKLAHIKLHNELIFRRQFMINSIQRLLFPSPTENGSSCQYNMLINSKPLQNGESAANTLRDLVKIHADKSDADLHATMGCFVNFLDCISRILDYPLKYPVIFKGSRSCVVNRKNNVVFPLYKLNKKSSRKGHDNFEHALRLLEENLSQLRIDCEPYLKI